MSIVETRAVWDAEAATFDDERYLLVSEAGAEG